MKKSSRRQLSRVIALGAALAAAAAAFPARAEDMSDSTMLLTGRLLKKAVAAAMDAPLTEDPESAEVMMALRSTRDAGLLPIFRKLRGSKPQDNQVFAMIAATILAKDAGLPPEGPDTLDMKAFLEIKDGALQTSALGTLINARAITPDQLKNVVANAPEAIQKTMAASELNLQGKLEDRSILQELMKSDQSTVKYDAAVTILEGPVALERDGALEAMNKMTAAHDLKQLGVQALMMDRIQKEKVTAALPWVVAVASDEKVDVALRNDAVETLLVMDAPEGPALLADLIQKQSDPIEQIKLGLIAIEHAAKIKPEVLTPLTTSDSVLAQNIARIGQKAAAKTDPTADLLELIKEGHPIVLDWAYDYSGRAAPEMKTSLCTALVNQATMVDNVRDRDYERAALTVERLLDEGSPENRKLVADFLNSGKRAVVDATLAGIYRSGIKDEADTVMQIWPGLTKAVATQNSANYAALILAREGRKEALTWLPDMVTGGTAQAPGFRALAGWHYAKLTGKSDALIKIALGD